MNEEKIREIIQEVSFQVNQATKHENSGIFSDMKKMHKETQQTMKAIPLQRAFYTVASLILLVMGWHLVITFNQNAKLATVITSQKNDKTQQEEYQSAADKRIDKLTDTVSSVQIDTAKTAALVDIISSSRFQINTAAVEQRVIKNLSTTSDATNKSISIK